MIGETINNYRISELLGEGGMGAVYLAEHPFMGRKAAIKVLRREFAEDPSLVERFMNEARAANAIRHPNIIDIIDVGRMPNGIPYLMMEFLEGETLSRRISRGTMPLGEAMDVMLQTTSALAAAHGKGIVHRDLKPDNLYMVPDEAAPGGIRVKVLDFGIAKLRGDLSGGSSKTQAGSLMGTPPYMSPEQCRGVNDEVDHRTDIYALGIIFFEMLCGAPPFLGQGWGDVVLAHLTKPPPSPRSRNAAIPESVEVIIMKALAKSASERFSSAADMRTALRAMSGASTFPPRPTAAGMAAASGSTMSGMPAPKQPTTFRTATGEMGSTINTMAESPSAKGAKSKRGLVIGAGVAAVIAIGGGFVVMQGKGKSGGDVALAPAIAAATTAPAVTPPAPAPAAKLAPREAPPAAPTQVLVRINSEPAGALVTDAKRGVVIGATPFEQRLERRSGTLGVRVAKDGYQPIDLEIPLGDDFEKAVRLEHQKPTHAASKPAASSGGKKVVASKSAPAAATPAPGPATAPPPVTTAPPPVAKPKAAVKW